MKRYLLLSAATLVLAVLIHLASIVWFPNLIMTYLQHRFQTKPGFGVNQPYHEPPITSAHREIVMPSPDLLYSGIGFDLSEKPLHITAAVPDSYWSISFYDFNTTNFYSVNDRQVNDNRLDILLVAEGRDYPDPGSATVVTAPYPKGLALIRMLIEDQQRIGDYLDIQKQLETDQPE